MKVSPAIIGTSVGILGSGMIIPALPGADDGAAISLMLAPVILGFVIGLIVDLSREKDTPNDPPPESNAP